MTGRPPASFYCNNCEAWTKVQTNRDWFGCACGEEYGCGECGYEIDRYGRCTRPAHLGFCPDSIENGVKA